MEQPRILIVDDENSLRKVLGDLLRLRGYTAEPVATGGEAVAAAGRERHEVAIVDLSLGEEEMTGLDVIREIKACSPETECIVLTGMPSQESAIEATNLGACAYLRKPFDVNELLSTITKALAKHGTKSPSHAPPRRPANSPTSTQRFRTYARDDLRSPLSSVLGLAQNVIEAETLEDAQAFARILQTEAKGVLDRLDEYLSRVASEQAQRLRP